MPRTLNDLFHGGLLPTKRGLDVSPAIKGLRGGTRKEGSRKAKARVSIQNFCNVYLSKHFTKGYGEHHLDLFHVIDQPSAVSHRGKRIVRVEPRFMGKTTIISLALVLKALAYQEKKFILLIGEGGTVAQSNLQTVVAELEENELLLQDFPHLMPARDAKGQHVKWTDQQIVVASGATVLAKGMGGRMRGLKRAQNRPDLGIIDDPESPETASSFITRQRHKKWFGGTFLGIGGDDWDVYVISNLPHHDGLAADLLRSKEWDGKLYRAINIPKRDDEKYPIGNTKEDLSALWPEGWPIEKLDAYRREPTVGSLGFEREMMNNPRDDKDKPFSPEEFTYVDVPPIHQWHTSYPSLVTFIDPAGGEKPNEMKKGRRDYASIVTAGRTAEGFIDILDVIMTKKLPDGQVGLLLDVYESAKPGLIGVEENMAKNLIGPTINQMARERNLYPTVEEVYQIRNKTQRILATQPLIAAGTIRFNKKLKETATTYFGQYDDFPGDHEDGPDATEGAIRLLESGIHVGMPSGVTGTSFWRPQ